MGKSWLVGCLAFHWAICSSLDLACSLLHLTAPRARIEEMSKAIRLRLYQCTTPATLIRRLYVIDALRICIDALHTPQIHIHSHRMISMMFLDYWEKPARTILLLGQGVSTSQNYIIRYIHLGCLPMDHDIIIGLCGRRLLRDQHTIMCTTYN